MNHILTDEQYDNALEMLRLFKINGKPADEVATPGQVELFGRIVFKISNRQFIMTLTQYGKSLFVALACIILTALDDSEGGGEKVIVGAPNEEKALIIMRYYTQHLGDSPLFAPLLAADNQVERLAQSATKDSLILKNGGMMFALTLNAGNSKKGFEAAMGEGASVFILDEACLISDQIESTAIRIIAGQGTRGMYVKIGNPFYRNTHFQKSSRDPRYLKLVIDYHQSLQEGRVTQDYIDEVRNKPFFDILYECKFPGEQQLDSKGYNILYKESLIDIAYMDNPLPLMGDKHIGIDVSHGGANFSTIVLRGQNQARLMFKEQTEDELILLTEAEKIARANGVPMSDKNIHIDKIGSAALCSRANELWPLAPDGHTNQFGCNVGERADPEIMPNGEPAIDERNGKPIVMFTNKRAQLAWRAWQWTQQGGKLFPKPAFDDLMVQRYKVQSDKRIKMKGKDEMASEGVPSPDVADAFNLTFDVKPKTNNYYPREPVQEEQAMTAFGI